MASNGGFLLNKRISLFETIYNLRRSLKLQAYPFDKWKKKFEWKKFYFKQKSRFQLAKPNTLLSNITALHILIYRIRKSRNASKFNFIPYELSQLNSAI